MADEFVYRWEVDNVSQLPVNRVRRSPIFFHCDIPWFAFDYLLHILLMNTTDIFLIN